MEFDQVLKARRSVRAFTEDPIGDDVIDRLLQAAVWAPSPLHQQPWEFIVIRQADGKQLVRTVCQEALEAVIQAGGPGWAAKYGLEFVEQAPVLIAVAFDPSKGGLGTYFNQPLGAFAAACAAVQNLLLAAAQEGLGSLWLTFFDPGKMCKALGVPDGRNIAGVIPLGVPQREMKAPPRKEPVVHHEKY
jgi:nitroreductase